MPYRRTHGALIRICRVPLSVAFLALVACNGDTNIRPTLTQETLIPAGDGVLVARVVNATSHPFPFNQLTVTPENINTSTEIKPERLISIDKTVDGSTVFASPLAPGRYALRSVRSFHMIGEMSFSRFVGTDVTFGTFDVAPGRVTDLGTLVYYRQTEGDSYEDVLFRIDDTDTGETLDKHLPFVSDNAESRMTWNDDGLQDERRDTYLSALQNPNTFSDDVRTPDGSVLFLGPMGVLLERTAAGDFVLDAVDTNLHLTAGVQNDAGDRVVAGEEGAVYVRPAGGDWRAVPLDSGFYVEELKFGADGQLVALARNKGVLSMLALGDDDRWRELNRFSVLSGWRKELVPPGYQPTRPRSPQKITYASIVSSDEGEFVRLGYVNAQYGGFLSPSKNVAYRYDPVTHEMTRVKNEKKIRPVLKSGAVDLSVRETSFLGLAGGTELYRRTPENTWTKVNQFVRVCKKAIVAERTCGPQGRDGPARERAFSLLSLPWFKDDLTGIVVVAVNNGGRVLSERYEKPTLMMTHDGGDTWTDPGYDLPREYCTELVSAFSEHLLLSCNGTTGEFYESTDDGESWTLVRELQSF